MRPGKILFLLTFFPMVNSYQANKIILIFRAESLKIFDGDSNKSPMLGSYCGDSLPPSQTSSRNKLFFHFYSDEENSGTGFKLEYNATSKNPFEIDSCTFYVYS